MMTAGASFVRIKHTRSAEARLKAAQDAFAEAASSVEELRARFIGLAERRMTRESVTSIFDRLFPKSQSETQTKRDNILSSILANYERADNGAFPAVEGTAYQFLNAITEYTDHSRSVKSGDRDENVARWEAANFGSGATLKSNALEVIEAAVAGNPYQRLATRYSIDLGDSNRPTLSGSLLDSVIDATIN